MGSCSFNCCLVGGHGDLSTTPVRLGDDTLTFLGVIYRILSPALGLMIHHNLRISCRDPNRSHPYEKKIYRNELVNLSMLFLTSCFPDLVQFFDDIPGFNEFTTLVALWFVHVYYTRILRGLKTSRNVNIRRKLFPRKNCLFFIGCHDIHLHIHSGNNRIVHVLAFPYLCTLSICIWSLFQRVLFAERKNWRDYYAW